MKTLQAFIKPFEAPQRNVKIKILVNFNFNTTFWNVQGGRGYIKGIIEYVKSERDEL